MGRRLAARIILLVAGALLLAATVPLSQPYRHSLAWRVPAEHRPKVELALRRGAEAFGISPEEYRRHTRPRIERVDGRTRISLVTHRSLGGGSYMADYDTSGAIASERVVGPACGATNLWDRFGYWLW